MPVVYTWLVGWSVGRSRAVDSILWNANGNLTGGFIARKFKSETVVLMDAFFKKQVLNYYTPITNVEY